MKKRILLLSLLFQTTIVVNAQDTTQTTTKKKLEIFGSAVSQNIYNDNTKDIPATTGLGIYFFRRLDKVKWLDFYELDAYINTSSTVDSIHAKLNTDNTETTDNTRRNLGNSILQPTLGRVAAKLSLTFHTKWNGFFMPNVIFGDFAVSSRNWNINSDSASNGYNLNVLPVSLRIGAGYDVIPFEDLEKFSIFFGIAPGFRYIGGDAYKSQELKKSIGLEKNFFPAVDFILKFKIDRFKVEFNLPWIFVDNNVTGLSGGQFVTNIGFVGGLNIPLSN